MALAALAAGALWLLAGKTVQSASSGIRPAKQDAKAAFAGLLTGAKGDPAALESSLDAAILAFQPLVEEGMVYRQRTAVLTQALHAKIRAGQPLDGGDIEALNRNIQDGYAVARRIFAVVDEHANWREPDAKTLRKAGFAELPLELRVKGSMLSLAGSLFLYDTYRLHVAMLAGDEKIRRVFNRGDTGYANRKNLLDEVTDEFLSLSGRMRVRDELRFCAAHEAAAAARYGDSPVFAYLRELIAQSPSRGRVAALPLLPPPATIAEDAARRTEVVRGDLHAVGEDSLNSVSMFFGNTVGLVETRKGKLWNNPGVAAAAARTLQPGDILLEKTPFRLTDTFIPGHWGHAAIWVGTEADLKALGLWDDPVVRPYQANIRAGRGIVEALRGGVTMNSIEHFLNIDDLAILRDGAPDRERQKHHVLLALRQVGKEYDFNFDVETGDKIVCSELVYMAYTDIPWPTDRTLGRYTISPDNVAAKALNGGPLRLQLFYHDGRPVTEKPLDVMAGLMTTDTRLFPDLPAVSLPAFIKAAAGRR